MALEYLVKCKYYGRAKTYPKKFKGDREYNNFKNWITTTRGYTNISFLKKTIYNESLDKIAKAKNNLSNSNKLELYLVNNDKPISFNKFVYCLIDNKKVVYVGKTNNLQSRILSHKKEGIKVFNSYAVITKFSSETTDEEVFRYEEKTIKLLKPKYNIIHN